MHNIKSEQPASFILRSRAIYYLESNHSKIVEVQLLCTTDRPPQSLSDLPQTSCACAPIEQQMQKKIEVDWTNIKGGCQMYIKAAPQQSWSDWTLVTRQPAGSLAPLNLAPKKMRITFKK